LRISGYSTGQEISRPVWNPNIHYHPHKSPLFVPIPSQMNLVHNLIFYFFKIYFNVILPPMLRSSCKNYSYVTLYQSFYLSSTINLLLFLLKNTLH